MKTVDINHNCDALSSLHRFKFDNLYGNIFVTVVMPLLLFSIAIREILYGHYIGVLAAMAGVSFFLALGYIQIFYNADITIDDEWISRFAFGRLIQRVGWDNIRLIRISREFGGPGCSYNVYQNQKKNSRLGIVGKLAFSDGMGDSVKFIQLMNINIVKHNIKIESVIGGVKTSLLQLPAIDNGKSEEIDLNKLDL